MRTRRLEWIVLGAALIAAADQLWQARNGADGAAGPREDEAQ